MESKITSFTKSHSQQSQQAERFLTVVLSSAQITQVNYWKEWILRIKEK
jgi:hypothetical protein